jgi:Sulfatase
LSRTRRTRWQSRAVRVLDDEEHPVREKLKDALVAISLSNLCFGHAWYYLLVMDATTHGYYSRYTTSALHLSALLTNIILFALLFWCGASLVRRSKDRRVQFIGDLALCATLVAGLDFVRLHLFYHAYMDWVWPILRQTWLASIIAMVLLAAVAYWHRLAARAAKMIIVLCIPLVGFTFAKANFKLLSIERATRAEEPSPPSMFRTIPPRRVVWVIFDAMDQRLAFRQRLPGVQMPEFDRLRQESFVANNAYPPSFSTQTSMPSLISNQRVLHARIVSNDELMLSLADGREAGWSQLPNVFSHARELGFNTALVGWHHPYGRILGPALNDYEWYANPYYSKTRAPTFWGSVRLQIRAMFPKIHTSYVALYCDSLQKSRSLVADPRYGLVMLHLLPPHAPCIYNPESKKLSIWESGEASGYPGSLALADRTLGELRRAMEASGVWNNTWVVISADHWWRESRQLDGKLDHRIPFIVKPAGAPVARTYSNPFSTIITHDLLLAILSGELRNARELPSWVDRHKTPPPPDYAEKDENDSSF